MLLFISYLTINLIVKVLKTVLFNPIRKNLKLKKVIFYFTKNNRIAN